MTDTDWGEYWWSNVTGPREVVSSIIMSLRMGRSAVLYVPYDLPWRHELRRCVRNNLENIPVLEDLIVDVIDIEDDGANSIDPGRYLLDKYALKDDRTKFREGGNKSIQDYFLHKEVMKNKLVWVKGIGKERSREWVSFCEHWEPKSVADGVFVVEVRDCPCIGRSKCIELLQYEECVSEYDVQLFNSLVLGGNAAGGLSATWKKYAAAITTHLCGADAEVARSFIERHRFMEGELLDTLKEIAGSGFFEHRGSGSHVLALYRAGSFDELRKRIWAGQVEILFPLIEKQRLEIVDLYRTQFEEEIKKGISQFGKEAEKPEDIELGTMVYMMKDRRLDIPERETRNKIHTLRECRNLLAHRDTCSLDQVAVLLSY